MDKTNFLYRFFVVLSLSLLFTEASAQNKPSDSISIRKDYTLPDPIKYEAFYDVKSDMYYLYPKVGNTVVGSPIAMSGKEYQDYVLSKNLQDYYREKSEKNNLLYKKDQNDAVKKGLIPSVTIKNKVFETIFGSNKIELIPQGYASFDLGGLYQKIENPLVLPQNRKNFAVNIQQRIQLGIVGKVGENLQLKANYDTQSGFAFENKMNLVWQAKGNWKDLQSKGLNDKLTGGEDKIIKRLEFGNVNMPLSTSLIRGSESLFGLKTDFQLGKTKGTLVISQQQGEARNVLVQGGGTVNTFKLNAIDYEDNQHYYLDHYFLNNYDNALLSYPVINSKINISRIEVWVLDQSAGNLQNQKSILGIRDLGEGVSGYPDNGQNNLYQSIVGLGAGIRDVNEVYNTIKGASLPNASGSSEVFSDTGLVQFNFSRRARKLQSTEFTFNPNLGYVSLNQRLNDNQLLAVSYSFTINGESKVYKVGEFSEESSSVLIAKLLKPNTSVNTGSPMWDLMMKNFYALNSNQIAKDDFLLNVYFKDPDTGGKENYLPTTTTLPNLAQNPNLLKLFNWDRLNMNNDLQTNGTTTGDGVFDFVPGITVDVENGKLIFTKAQPFGSYLQSIGVSDSKYLFTDLYTQQKQVAATSNMALRYTMEGRYKGSQEQGISLGAINVPQGSVKVTANGVQLIEGQDYTVDYMLGSVTIINEAIKQSGQAINISLENQLTFNTQRKRFWGLNLERKFSEHFTLGGTVINYAERPLTQKVNMGQEAVNNTMAGFNMLYNNEMPLLTRLTDKIPFVNTEANSHINFKAEGAYLIPGQNKGINDQSYIDDFEQTSSKISLKDPNSWALASKPEKNTNDPIFTNAGSSNDIKNGYGRGLLSWYNIDPRFYGVGGNRPSGVSVESVSNHASRRVKLTELYNQMDVVAGDQTFTNTLDITYYPKEKGPYNLNPSAEPTSQRWAGLMRPISVSNFTSSNVEYVEFWMMDPYADGKAIGAKPKILLQLGNVSEDILKDGKLAYENGLPTPSVPSQTSTSNWGTQPQQYPVLYAFSSQESERSLQDVGHDGLSNEQESAIFGITNINAVTNVNDPAADDFVYYLSNKFTGTQASSVMERYKYFRNPDGNSVANSLEVSSQTPDAEDVNRDYNLDQSENYLQYTVNLDKGSMVLNQNNIVDMKQVQTTFANGQTGTNKWYLFRIPVKNYDTNAGVQDESILNNVRYARIILEGFDETSTIRFGTFDLVRSDWRDYPKSIAATTSDDEGVTRITNSTLDIGSVNLEENSVGDPPYVLPPGIDRQVLSGTTGTQRQNESSLYLKASSLEAGKARGVVKNTSLDMRRYKNLKLFVHAQDLLNTMSTDVDPNAKFFIRFGSDATDNYYEYESSLKYTASNARSPLDIWPAENDVDLEIQNFVDAKQWRDANTTLKVGDRTFYTQFGDSNKKIYVKGRPSLGGVTTIMLGIRNIDASGNGKTIVLWIDEIRLSGIDNKGGYAGNASLNFNLGDFAMVNANASYTSVGFGSIIQKPSEREQTANSALHINTTVNVDKFLPEKLGMRIPVNYSYTQTIQDPKYNPLDTDVEFSKAQNKADLKKVARTYTQQRSLGVVNMHKERVNPNKKPKFYDVENISVTALYNDDYYRDIYTKRNLRQYLKGNIDYNYSFKPYLIRPFNKMISDTAKSYKYLRWVKEINLNPVPTRFSFRTEIDRNYNELQYRNVDAILSGNAGEDFDVFKNRSFYFGWQYNLGFNFTKSLKLDINAATRTLNDNLDENSMTTNSIFSNPFRSGRPVLYNHRIQLNYRFPFDYFPYLDFINAELGYGMAYNWNARSTVATNFLNSSTGVYENLGNISQNTNNIIGTSTVDFPKLLGKFNYFQKLNTVLQKRKQEVDSLNNAYTQAWSKKKGFKFKNYKFKNKLTPLQDFAYIFLSIKQINLNYNENNGTVLPGVLSTPNFFGLGQENESPTYGFLLGSQADIRERLFSNGWLSSSTLMNDPYTQLTNKNTTGSIQIVPVNDLRIDLNFVKNYTRNLTQSGYNLNVDTFENETVNYSLTDWTLKTAFKDPQLLYQDIYNNARTISQKLGGTLDANGFTAGHNIQNAYILVPAFNAAVTGRSSGAIGDAKKSKFPLPNWKLVYSGLKNIPLINAYFSKFDLLHGYKSLYTVSGIQSNIDYYNDPNGIDVNKNYLNPYIFSRVDYVESFAPLTGIDVTLRNNMQFRFQYNRERMYSLGLVNSSLTQDNSKEYIFGLGYIIKNLKMNLGSRAKDLKSDLNIRGDFSLRDNTTSITNILSTGSYSQITGGQRILSVKLSADYSMSKYFNVKFFYDQLMTKYKISTSYPLSTIRAGLTATFTFGGAGGY